MTEKEKLVELLKNIPQVNHFEAQIQGLDYVFGCAADYLLANGVVIPIQCKDCHKRETLICPFEQTFEYPWRNVNDTDYCSYGERKDNE